MSQAQSFAHNAEPGCLLRIIEQLCCRNSDMSECIPRNDKNKNADCADFLGNLRNLHNRRVSV